MLETSITNLKGAGNNSQKVLKFSSTCWTFWYEEFPYCVLYNSRWIFECYEHFGRKARCIYCQKK